MRRSTLPLVALALAAAPALRAQNLALQLVNGVAGGIDVPTDPLEVPPTGITVEAWIAYDDRTIPTGVFRWPTICRQNVTPQQEVYNFRVQASNTASRTLQFSVRVPSGLQAVTYNFVANEFVPYTHVAATYDGQTMKLFKNGVQVATRTLTTTAELVNTGGILRIGNGDPSVPGAESWNGLIDELRIWPMARSAQEIQATMNQALAGVAGGVLSFPLDAHAIEVNNGLIGVQFGTMTFIPGAPITAAPTSSTAVASSTSTCPRSITALLGSMPQIGNSAFAVWAVRGPVPASAPFGVVLGSANSAPPGLQVLGVTLAVDPGTILYQSFAVPPTDLLGNARAALPLPLDNSFIGIAATFQWAFADSTCGPQGFTASNGVRFTVY
jgi:hypothetical protein